MRWLRGGPLPLFLVVIGEGSAAKFGWEARLLDMLGRQMVWLDMFRGLIRLNLKGGCIVAGSISDESHTVWISWRMVLWQDVVGDCFSHLPPPLISLL